MNVAESTAVSHGKIPKVQVEIFDLVLAQTIFVFFNDNVVLHAIEQADRSDFQNPIRINGHGGSVFFVSCRCSRDTSQ
jgi:hypothetical protein